MANLQKRVISTILILSIVLSSIQVSSISASAQSTTKKTNFNFISTDTEYTEYTYDENGDSFKVIETATADLSNITSKIYKLSDEGNYVLYDDFSTLVVNEKDKIILTFTRDDSNETIILDKNSLTESVDISAIENSVMETASDSLLTDWQFSSRTTGDTKIVNWTLTVVSSVIGGIVGYLMGGGILGAGVKAAITAVAGIIIEEVVPKVYYSQYVYYKWIIGIDPPLYRGEKVETFFYSNSSHSNFLGSVVNEYVDPLWEN